MEGNIYSPFSKFAERAKRKKLTQAEYIARSAT